MILSRFSYRQLRVTDNAEIKSVAASLDGLDILVNNAGNVKIAGRKDDPVDVFEEMVRVHLLSAHNMAQACLEMLSASTLSGGASVVGIASLTSFIANPFVPGYGAGKAGSGAVGKNAGGVVVFTWHSQQLRGGRAYRHAYDCAYCGN
jgi:3-oxoacyl-[acyl-carrier protein] reductase